MCVFAAAEVSLAVVEVLFVCEDVVRGGVISDGGSVVDGGGVPGGDGVVCGGGVAAGEGIVRWH